MANQNHEQFIDNAVELMRETQSLVWGSTPEAVPDETAVVLQSTLLAECTGQHIGVRACIEERVGSPANAIARGLLGNTVLLIYMSHHEDEADFITLRWYRSETRRQRKRVAENARVHNTDKSAVIKALDDELQRIAQMVKELGYSRLPKLPSIPDMAASRGSKAITKHGLDILSQYVHSGVDSLARRFAPSESHAGAFAVQDQSAFPLVQTASLANASLFDAGISVAHLQDWKSLDALTKAADEFGESFARLLNAAQTHDNSDESTDRGGRSEQQLVSATSSTVSRRSTSRRYRLDRHVAGMLFPSSIPATVTGQSVSSEVLRCVGHTQGAS